MPGEDPKHVTESESESSYETASVEEEEDVASAKAKTAKAKMDPTPKTGSAGRKPVHGGGSDSGSESLASTLPSEAPELGVLAEPEGTEVPGKDKASDVEESSDSRAGLTRRKRERRGQLALPALPAWKPPEPEAPAKGHKGNAKPPEPEGPPRDQKGKGKQKGRSMCGMCWCRVGPTDAAKGQHIYWNLHCLTWQQWDSGRHGTWSAAAEAALRQKTRRGAKAWL